MTQLITLFHLMTETKQAYETLCAFKLIDEVKCSRIHISLFAHLLQKSADKLIRMFNKVTVT